METKNVLTDQSRTQINEPRLAGDILLEFVNNSDSPLAKGYRKFVASKESSAEKGDQSDE